MAARLTVTDKIGCINFPLFAFGGTKAGEARRRHKKCGEAKGWGDEMVEVAQIRFF
jgi:hypothetical protein